METLRISPKYTADHWRALDQNTATHWPKAVGIVRDRLHGRFLHFADKCLNDSFSGFVVLSIDCLLVETIQQFIEGKEHAKGESRAFFTRFLERRHFQPAFDSKKVRDDFYFDIRCGLLHQAEAKKKWLLRRKQKALLKKVGADGYIIDVERFHAAIKSSLRDYFALLCKPESAALRANLWMKMNYICDARIKRGAMEAIDLSASDPTA